MTNRRISADRGSSDSDQLEAMIAQRQTDTDHPIGTKIASVEPS
jgi:hypothetical protein